MNLLSLKSLIHINYLQNIGNIDKQFKFSPRPRDQELFKPIKLSKFPKFQFFQLDQRKNMMSYRIKSFFTKWNYTVLQGTVIRITKPSPTEGAWSTLLHSCLSQT